MAIAFSAAAMWNASVASPPLNVAVAIPAGALVIVAGNGNTFLGSAPTVNGVAMTHLIDISGGLRVWYIFSVGSATQVVLNTAINVCAGVVLVYTGVEALGAQGSVTGSVGGGSSNSVAVTTVGVNSWVVTIAQGGSVTGNNGPVTIAGSPAPLTVRESFDGTVVSGLSFAGGDTNGGVTLGTVETGTATNNGPSIANPQGAIVLELVPPVTASATAAPTAGAVALTVSFTATPASGAPPYTYAWSFGDGQTSTLQNPAHTYSSVKTFTPTLTITDNVGGTVSPAVPSITTSSGKTGGTLGNNAIGRRPMPHISTPDRIENSTVNGGT
jgi:hypothetical protein